MRHILYRCVLLVSIFSIQGCEKLLMDAPENTPTAVFDALWEDFDYHYPRFETINLDWDSIYNVYRPQINNSMNAAALFDICTEMLNVLNDGHVWMRSNFKEYYGSPDRTGFIYTYDYETINTYLDNLKKQNMFTYGYLTNDIGYIHISTFFINLSGYEFIDNIIDEFQNTSSIIIDIRANAGGSSLNAETIASRFYDQKREYRYSRFRNGPEHTNFGEKLFSTLEPAGNRVTNKNIVVLVDRSVGSAGEDFVLMMEVLPNVTLVGDSTSGNVGGVPVWRELQNGWIYYMPTGLEYSMGDVNLYKIGISPDIYVELPNDGISNGKDLLLEKALEVLN